MINKVGTGLTKPFGPIVLQSTYLLISNSIPVCFFYEFLQRKIKTLKSKYLEHFSSILPDK